MRKIIFILIGLFIFTTLVGCGQEAKGKNDLKKITIMLDWYHNTIHSFLYDAEEKGYYKKERLYVEFKLLANQTNQLNIDAYEKVTMGLYYQPDVIMAKANEDLPIKSIAGIVKEPLNHLVYNSKNAPQTPKDLEGKKVGTPGIPINEALVKTMV